MKFSLSNINEHNLNRRVLLRVTLLVGVLAGLTVSLNIWKEYDNQRELLSQRGTELVKFLANAISSPLWSMDMMAVHNTLELVASDPDYIGVIVREQNEATVTAGDLTVENDIMRFTHTVAHYDEVGKREIRIGDIELRLSTKQLQRFLQKKILEDVVLLLVLLSLNMLMIYRGLRLIRHPMEQLTRSMKQYSEGNYEHNVYGLGRSDEIGVMAEALEILRQNSVEREQIRSELMESNQLLEQRVTERTRQLEQEVEERKHAEEIAQEANETKSIFLANMSHEIRTPMSGIIGLSHLGLQHDLNPQLRDYLNRIHDSAQSLLSIINDILDFSKIEAGKIELELIDFELQSILDHALSIVRLKAEEKGVELECEVASDAPRYLKGDMTRLTQVLINLIGNAVKFTDTGKVQVQIQLEQQHDEYVVLKFIVSDTGIGLSEAQQEQLFISFSQADNSTTRNYGGTGLGLSISKQLVEMMRGDISVESELGVGSVFTFTASLQVGERPQELNDIELDSDALENVQLEGLKVLLVEDNETNQIVAQHILKGLGVEVVIVGDGLAAVDIVNEDIFDLVLMDLQMPKMDGYQATKQIRVLHSASQLPIVAMTANAMKGDREKALSVGMNDYITKPIELDKLYKVLGRYYDDKGSKSLPEVTASETATTSWPSQVAGLDLEEGVQRLMNDKEIYLQVLETFAQDNQSFVIDLTEQVNANDSVKVKSMIHALKGSAANISANGLFALMERIESVLGQANKVTGQQLEEIDASLKEVMQSIDSLKNN